MEFWAGGSRMCPVWVWQQTRILMRPAPPKREEELAEHVAVWQDKMRRLEAHGDEFKMPPGNKVNAFRMLMTGKAKRSFDLWEADRDNRPGEVV